ncbi:hypothetical protein IKE79_00725 [Candidatus Saccharibacteria bacterium]|nr:hypothetical protein [Candidatus Saccharibacteria bacterium]
MINILVIAIAVLTILSAVALMCGSNKQEKRRSLWFLAAAIGEVMWGVSIAVALSLPPTDGGYATMPLAVKGIYVGAIVMDSAMLGYVSWKYKFGKILTSLFIIAGVVLAGIFLYDPSVLYSSFTLAHTGNSVTIDVSRGWYVAYIAYFCTIVPAFCLSLVYKIRHSSNKDTKKGYLFFLVGLAVAGFMSLIFDLIMPLSRYDLIWVGPLLIGLTMMGFYYAVLRYRMISLTTGWLKMMSTLVLASGVVIVYLLVFHLIFSALFKVASPSPQVILLNFIMVAIVLALAPAIAEIWAMIKSLIMTKQIDIAYIVKKLSKLDRRKLNYKDISGFLAEHLHFEYVGFLLNGRYFVKDESKMPAEVLAKIAKLPMPAKGIWQSVSGLGSEAKNEGLTRVAVMTNTNGGVIGHVILGKPTTKAALDREDVARLEMIIDLMGTIIENGGRKS